MGQASMATGRIPISCTALWSTICRQSRRPQQGSPLGPVITRPGKYKTIMAKHLVALEAHVVHEISTGVKIGLRITIAVLTREVEDQWRC
jgi:hypothetical protein